MKVSNIFISFSKKPVKNEGDSKRVSTDSTQIFIGFWLVHTTNKYGFFKKKKCNTFKK